MHRILWILIPAALAGATSGWLELISPVMTPSERKEYISLPPESRPAFEKAFWDGKSITPSDYFDRIQRIDADFGSGVRGSGANTDQGRVYLSLGPPNRIVRLPSSRNFFPVEIWYYETAPAIEFSSELRLMFFLKNGRGFYKLYSPTLNTIRDLLTPQAGLQGMFGPNDLISEADIRTTLNYTPAEDEVVSAAVGVAAGITGTGNDEILGRVISPRACLTRPLHPEVKSKFLLSRTAVTSVQSPSPYAGAQVDLKLETSVRRELRIEVLQGATTVYRNETRFEFEQARPIRYLHRLDLLPGQYRILFYTDSNLTPYTLDVPEQRQTGGIVLAAEARDSAGRRTPFEFDGYHLDPSAGGRFALLALAKPTSVEWIIRRGPLAVWKKTIPAEDVAIVELPLDTLEPGVYRLEANADGEARTIDLSVKQPQPGPQAVTVSFNANLAPAARMEFAGHQWMLRGKLDEAMRRLRDSLEKSPASGAQVELARVEALAGRYDDARDLLRTILGNQPNNFDALSVMAYTEAKLQDYVVAAELYRRALTIQDSPALRLALAKLPQ